MKGVAERREPQQAVVQSLTIPTTFEPTFVNALAELNASAPNGAPRVGEVYGSLQSSVVGSARPSKYLPRPTVEQLSAHVQALHGHGIRFSYTLNAPCMGNREYTPNGRRAIVDLVDRAVDAGTDSVVVAIPYLMELVRERHPQVDLVASSLCYIRSVREARGFADLGCRRLVVDPDINRNFALLERIAAAVPECELEVIANHFCLQACHYEPAHYSNTGHGSQSAAPGETAIYSGYHLLKCHLHKLEDPVEFLRAPWIPPTAVWRYARVPVRWVKLAGRGADGGHILATARAYMTGEVGDNLLPLLGWEHWQLYARNDDGSTLPPLAFRLDPARVGGTFFDFFARESPECTACDGCRYCDSVAARALTYDAALRDRYVSNMRRELQRMLTHEPTEDEHAAAVAAWERRAAACALCGTCG